MNERNRRLFGVGLAVLCLWSLFAAAMIRTTAVQAQTSVHDNYTSVSPAGEAAAVTPSDVTDVTNQCRSLYVGGTGNVTVNMGRAGTSILYTAVPAGTVLPIRVLRVWSTGTSATNIVCLF